MTPSDLRAPSRGAVSLPAGTIHYGDVGSGPPVVFLHGYLMNGRLWDPVVARLSGELRCLTPDLPLGSHREAMRAEADLTPPGLADLIADFLEALDLRDVTLVANDSGGALAQLVVTRRPERVGRLVLTSCDAFDNFPPRAFRPLVALARVPGALTAALAPLRLRAPRQLPIAFGWLSHVRLPDDVLEAFVAPMWSDRAIRRDLVKVTRGLQRRYTQEAARLLPGFERPALIAFGADDRFFPLEHARRLGALLPSSRVVDIAGARTFVMWDQPARTAELIGGFVAEGASREGAAVA